MRAMAWASTALVLAILTPSDVTATIYLVRPDGTGDFPTIQAAVNAASSGDEIVLTDGTFTGPGNRDIDFGGRDLVVRSESNDPLGCRIDCEGSALDPHRGFWLHTQESAAARIQGIEILRGHAVDYGGGIAMQDSSSATILNCIITECFAGYAGGGISCRERCRPVVRDCLLAWNESSGDIVAHGGGMYCGHYCYAQVERCTFWGNRASLRGGGFHCHTYSNATLSGCTFYGNASLNGANVDIRNYSMAFLDHSIAAAGEIGAGVACENGSDVFLTCCDVYGNCGGDWVGCLDGQLGLYGNFAADPLFCAPQLGDFGLQDGSPCGPSEPCGLVGAWPLGCGTADAAEPESVGRLAWIAAQPDVSGSCVRLLFRVPEAAGAVRLEILDVTGGRVRTLLQAPLAPGGHDAIWDGRDDRGGRAPAGVFFARLQAGPDRTSRRILLMR